MTPNWSLAELCAKPACNMRIIIPVLFCFLAATYSHASEPDTLTPPNGNIIYSPNCTTGGLGAVFGIVIPTNPTAVYQWQGPNGFTANQQSFTPPDTGWYQLIVTVNDCPSMPDSIHIQYFEPPMVQINATSPFYCPTEDSIHLSATANSPLLFWRRLLPNGSSQYIGGGPDLYFSGSQLGNVMERILVTANGAYGCEGMDTVLLMRQGIVTPSTPVLDCPGDSLILSVTGAGSFLWNTGDTTATLHTIADSARIFTVSVTDANGCTTSGSQAVYIQNGAYISIQALPSMVCPGDTALLQAAGGASYLWENGDTLGSRAVVLQSPDTFHLSITTAEACVVEKTIAVGIIPPPEADISFLPAEICVGDSVRILVANPDTTFYNLMASPDSTTTYTFQLEQRGCTAEIAATLTVNPNPTVSIAGPDEVCAGESVTLIAQGSSSGLEYQWNTGTVDSLLSLVPEGPEQAYWVSATDTLRGCIAADTSLVLVHPLPDTPLIACEALYETLTFHWNFDAGLAYTFEVLSGQAGQALSDSSLQVSNLLPGQEINFLLIATDSMGCRIPVEASCLAAMCNLQAELDTISPICLYPGSPPVALSAMVSGSLLPGNGWWDGTAVDSATATFAPAIAGPGLHPLTYRYQEGPCLLEANLEVLVDRPLSAPRIGCESTPNSLTFRWPQLPQDSLYEVEVLSGQAGLMLSDTSYFVEGLLPGETVELRILAHGEAPCGIVAATKKCQSEDCHTTAAPLTQIICPGESVSLQSASIPGAVYQWSPTTSLSCGDCPNPIATPAAATTYTLAIVEANGCMHTSSTTVAVGALPESLLPDTLGACAGQPFLFCLPGEATYRWHGPHGALQLGPCLYFPQPAPAINGMYRVEALLPGGCRLEREVILFFDSSPDCDVESGERKKN